LIAPPGTPIFAVGDGVVVEWNAKKEFYHHTFAVVVQHHGFVARYCEIRGVATGIGRGSIVKAGDHIADVREMLMDSMLHLEIYSKPYAVGPLTDRKNAPFQRRADLQNPTTLLDRLANDLPRTK
jgi:murein DD-endopeptidase MepM/ murein hydrolase activator NlpD